MWPWKQLRGNLLKCRVDWTDLDLASSPGTFSDLRITTMQLSPPTQDILGLKQSCFLLPWLEKFPLALRATTKEGKRRGHHVRHWEVGSAVGWIPSQGSPAARLRLWFPSHLFQAVLFLVHPSGCLGRAENFISGAALGRWTTPHSLSYSKGWLRTAPRDAGLPRFAAGMTQGSIHKYTLAQKTLYKCH